MQSHTRAARQVLECVLMYASTQLVMWLMKHDDEHVGEMDLDEQQQQNADGHGHRADGHALVLKERERDRDRDRRLSRKSLTLADRLRRGMTGEMSMDLQALIAKAKPVVSKSTEILGAGCVDLTQVLANFVEERVVAPQ